ncbi:tetratricopeptide repeat-containing sensor histidine kinase [Flavobacterium sp.]|uniref:tetratricopeptide repeat-containing sensor histidine kinase n=1 Tax=Flavobacterium sp. TaxID=239 RepID=UPI002CD4B5C7|nr:tetratricopeptide repeat-containing sensor histidine kinase [Flavobacterium sp.]HSD09271.1 tetratricopeptide repeat-containing sensor histidine kinase [Flavobacterium sp.]
MMFIFKINKWLLFSLLLAFSFANGQDQNAVTILKTKLQKTTVDTTKINLLNEISSSYKYTNAKEGLQYAKQALTLAEKKQWKKGMAEANGNLGICNQTLSNYTEAIAYLNKAVQLNKHQKNQIVIVYNLNDIASCYFNLNNYKKALNYYQQSLQINQKINDPNGYAYCLTKIGEIYAKEKKYEKAVDNFSEALKKFDKNQTNNINNTLNQLSNVYLLLSKSDLKNKEKYIALSNQTLKRIAAKQEDYSQSVEVLKASLKGVMPDTTRINILNKITSNYFYTKPREGIYFGEKALKLATKINWKKGIAKANDNIGVCQWVLSDFSKAINCFYKSLFIYQGLNDKNGISAAYNNLGLTHLEIKKYNLAFTYFSKAYDINKETNNKVLMVYNLNNIAVAHYLQKNYEKALKFYNQSKELNHTMHDMNGLAYVYSKIGKIFADQKKYTESLDYLIKALESYDKDQSYNIGNTYIEIGSTYYKMALENPNAKKQLLAKSFEYLNHANQLFNQIQIPEGLNSSYLELYKTTKAQGNFEQALDNFEKHNILQDSLFSDKNKNKLANLQSKREIDIRDKQIEIQKLKINSASKKVYLLVTITLSIAVLLILFFYLYMIKTSTNKLLLEKNEEIININKQKDKFFSIIAHDLRGPFSGFLGLTELLAEDIDSMDKEEIQFSAVNMKSSANNLNRLLDNLLEWSKMEQGLIPFAPKKYNISKIIAECIETQEDSINKKKIQVETLIDESLKICADKYILQSVIRNILSNAIKFTPREGTIKIKATENHKNTIISITDTGIGMSAKILQNIFKIDIKTNRKGTDDEPSSGLGLILCKEFIEKHGGKIWIESVEKEGSTVNFSIPKKYTIESN